MQKAVLYVRYSSRQQRDVSIDQQIRACQQYAERNGIDVINIYEDHALSGTSDRRPAFQRMIEDAKNRSFDYVIVYSLDRFARDRYDSAVYKRKLRDCGVKVLSAVEAISDDATGVLVESLLEGLAEYYSKELSRKVLRGHEDNARKCLVNGYLPLGFCKAEDGRYAIDEAGAAIVRESFERVASGESFRSIIDDFNSRGLRTKKGKTWNRSSFNTMLSNPRYTGVYIYNDVRVEGGIPQIIDTETYNIVQAYLANKANPRTVEDAPRRRRNENGTYLLTGKIYCGQCKSPMTGVSGTGKHGELHYYYACTGRRNKRTECEQHPVRRDYIEQEVTRQLRDTVLQPDTIRLIADAAIAYQEQSQPKTELDTLTADLAEVERSINNLVRAIEVGVFSSSTQNRLQELESRREALTYQISAARQKTAESLTRAQIIAMLEMYRKGDITDKMYQEGLIDAFLVAVYVYGDHLHTVFHLPDGSTVETSTVLAIDTALSSDTPTGVRITGGEGDQSAQYEPGTIIMVGCLFAFVGKINSRPG